MSVLEAKPTSRLSIRTSQFDPTRTLASTGAVLFSVAGSMLPFGFHAQRVSDLLVRLCFLFDRRFHDTRFAGPIEAEHNHAPGGDRTSFRYSSEALAVTTLTSP